MKLDIKQNTQDNRFEAEVEGKLAKVEYMDRPDKIVFTHTEVPVGLEGKGVGSALAKHVLDYAKEQGKKVLPLCPFIKAYIQRHPEYKDNLVAGF
ncbi:MAG: GNAT family N-acetyltransferase [Bacteroidota bacterium]